MYLCGCSIFMDSQIKFGVFYIIWHELRRAKCLVQGSQLSKSGIGIMKYFV